MQKIMVNELIFHLEFTQFHDLFKFTLIFIFTFNNIDIIAIT